MTPDLISDRDQISVVRHVIEENVDIAQKRACMGTKPWILVDRHHEGVARFE